MNELDVQIAEQVLGWTRINGAAAIAAFEKRSPTRDDGSRFHGKTIWVCDGQKMACLECGSMPPFSTDIAEAWRIADLLHLTVTPKYLRGEHAWGSARCNCAQSGETNAVGITNHQQWTIAETAPLAICLAALAMAGGKP